MMKKVKFSVLMSVYNKENPDYFTKIVFVCYDDETKEIYDKLAKKIIR